MVSSDVAYKILVAETATAETWEEIKPNNVEFTSMHLLGVKVIYAEGTVTKNNGVVCICSWNHFGVCHDRTTYEIIEEGCL